LECHLISENRLISLEYIFRSDASWFGGNVGSGGAEAESDGCMLAAGPYFYGLREVAVALKLQ
jgi:hypothetical protein